VDDLLTTGASGLAGAIVGAITGLLGIKGRLDRIEAQITDKIMTREACLECRTMCRQNNDTRISSVAERLRSLESHMERMNAKLDRLLEK
jgi:ABC-type uncharacterized transport system permease subunit